MKFQNKQKATKHIPTSSMPDVVFILLIFFMVTTVFKEFRGLPVTLPDAKQIEKMEGKRNIVYIWLNQDKGIMIDDIPVNLDDVDTIIRQKLTDNPRIVISLKIDRGSNMRVVNTLQNKLREANALRVNYSSIYEPL